jgi:hypothetical protein
VFGTVLESSELSLYSLTPWQCGEQCSGRFSERLLRDVFTWQ